MPDPQMITADFGLSFLILAALSVTLSVVSTLLNPPPKLESVRAESLGAFRFPTATEGRAIPVVWGTALIKAPNVIWYGHLRKSKIEEGYNGGYFNRNHRTIAIRYKLGVSMALCYGPIDELTRIKVGKDWLTDAVDAVDPSDDEINGVTLDLNYQEFFGGRAKGGGIGGPLQIYGGFENQIPDPYLESQLGVGSVPGYVDIAHCVFNGDVGESTSVEPWRFEVKRFPNNLTLAGSHHIIGDDANPAEVLYEILTSTTFGLAMDPDDIDFQSFIDVGETMFDELNGFSFVLDVRDSASKTISEILRQMDALLYVDQEGKMVVRLIRADFVLGDLLVFDESNISEVTNYARVAWNTTANSVEVQYVDRDKDYFETSARAQDLANVAIQDGRHVSTQIKYPGVLDAGNAARLAARELRKSSYPLAKITIECNRQGATLVPGDAFKFSWAQYGIEDMVMRAMSIELGDVDKGRVVISAVEDLFSLGTTLFADSPQSGWVAPSLLPVPVTTEIVRDAPSWFMLTESIPNSPVGERFMHMAQNPTGNLVNFTPFVDDGTGTGYLEAGSADGFTPMGLLLSAYAENTLDVDTTGLTIYTLDDPDSVEGATASQIEQFGRGLAWIQGATAAGDEIIGFESITDMGGGEYLLDNVHRGLLDTLPAAHSADAKIWFFIGGSGASDQRAFTATQAINVKSQTLSETRELDITTATARALTFASRSLRPYPVGNFQINGSRYTASVGGADVTLTWAHRVLDYINIQDQSDATPTGGQDTDVEYVVTFYKTGTTQYEQFIVDSSSPPPTNTTWTSVFYPRADIKIDAAQPTGDFSTRVTVSSRLKSDTSLTSRVMIDRTFIVTLL